MSKNYYAIIMAGGVGSRFWPISRTSHPKQYLDIMDSGKTLIQATYERFLPIVPKENIFILTNERYKDLVLEQLPELNADQALCEPEMRNTAPCIAYAMHKIHKLNPDAAVVVAPSDHLILNSYQFAKDVESALVTAGSTANLITLGIKPSRPDTGYGYIRFTEDEFENGFKKVAQFTEKPDRERAEAFIQSGDYLWNAGIFIWSTKAILEAFQQHEPELNTLFQGGTVHYNTPGESLFLKDNYGLSKNISIDYAILEKADNIYVLPVDFGWSDLGTWASLYTLAEQDGHGNVVTGSDNTILYDTRGCMVNLPANKKVIIKGLTDFIIAESNDTLMICPKNSEQEVKQVVADVKVRFGESYV